MPSHQKYIINQRDVIARVILIKDYDLLPDGKVTESTNRG